MCVDLGNRCDAVSGRYQRSRSDEKIIKTSRGRFPRESGEASQHHQAITHEYIYANARQRALSSCTENVPAVHQLLVYQKLFVRWTQSTLNRRLLDREPAVRVSHPRIMEHIMLHHLQHVRGVTSQVFKHLGIPSVFRWKVIAKLPCHVRDLLISTCSNQINVTEKC